MKDYNVAIKVRNNYFLQEMKNAGFKSIYQINELSGVPLQVLYNILNLKVGMYYNIRESSPGDRPGIRVGVQRVADFLKVLPESLFPPQHRENPLTVNNIQFTANIQEIERLCNADPIDPQKLLEAKEQKIILFEAIECLDDREKKIICARLDGDSLKECGDKIGRTVERARQIHTRAVRKLREKIDRIE